MVANCLICLCPSLSSLSLSTSSVSFLLPILILLSMNDLTRGRLAPQRPVGDGDGGVGGITCPCNNHLNKRHLQTVLCQDDFVLKVRVLFSSVIHNETTFTPRGRLHVRWSKRAWTVQVIRAFKVSPKVRPAEMAFWKSNLKSRSIWRPSDGRSIIHHSTQACSSPSQHQHQLRHQQQNKLRLRLRHQHLLRLSVGEKLRGSRVLRIGKRYKCFPRQIQLFEYRACQARFVDQPQLGLEADQTFLVSGHWRFNENTVDSCSLLLAWKETINFQPSLNVIQRVSVTQRRFLRNNIYSNQCHQCAVQVCTNRPEDPDVCRSPLQTQSKNSSAITSMCLWNIDEDLRHCSALFSSCRKIRHDGACQWRHAKGYATCHAINERNRAYHISNRHDNKP